MTQKPKQSVIKPISMAEKENTDSFSRKAQDILHESLAISTEESQNSSN